MTIESKLDVDAFELVGSDEEQTFLKRALEKLPADTFTYLPNSTTGVKPLRAIKSTEFGFESIFIKLNENFRLVNLKFPKGSSVRYSHYKSRKLEFEHENVVYVYKLH